MQYMAFHPGSEFKIALLVFDLDFDGMRKSYVEDGLIPAGADSEIEKSIIAYKLPSLLSANKKKRKAISVGEQREYLNELLAVLKDIGVEYIVVSQPEYFKTLTGASKAALEVGVLFSPDSTYFNQYADMKVCYTPNYKMAFYDPVKTSQGIQTSMKSIVAALQNNYVEPGAELIKHAYYPQTFDEIRATLYYLQEMGDLTCDIETFSLKAYDAGIASIAFAWDQHSGVAFQVDYAPGFINYAVRELLIEFFTTRWRKNHGRTIYHNASFDLTVLIHQLFTHSDNEDYDEYDYFDAITHRVECTKIISYLATNSCAGNKLSLKEQAVEFAGNYAVDNIEDVTKIPVHELLEYNLIDCCATWYVYNKNYPLMLNDNQENVYKHIFLPSMFDIIGMQLTGVPVDMEQVAESKRILEGIKQNALDKIRSSTIALDYTEHLKQLELEKLHAKWKKKRTTIDQIDLEFNPSSDIQLAGFLYDQAFLGLPVLGLTDSGAPSTKSKYIKELKNHTQSQAVIDILEAIIDLKDSDILLSTFIPALEGARLAPDGNYYMHGNFNLGGTVSGRLSSSDPNLQNIPAKSRLAKYIKICVKAPKGWLFVGLDFDSLEDKISALTTKDPNKLKVYTDGYDGHSLRAYSYFKDRMPDIDGTTVEGINSIADKYPGIRQSSKTPTFLLTYGGTKHGLIENCRFDEETAEKIDSAYHELYKVSDEWVADKINGAMKNGYIEAAFGLRVRTPILEQIVLTKRHTPAAAKAEARTAGNALGQSWGLLNNRAASEFMDRVKKYGYRRKIKMCMQIHDAQYYLIKDSLDLLLWFNKNLVECVQWQQHPDIYHPDVKISGKVAIFHPSWANENTIPNDATDHDILELEKKLMKESA
jgi:DNA polymerase I